MSNALLSVALKNLDIKSPQSGGLVFNELCDDVVLEIFNLLYIRDCVRIKRVNKTIGRLALLAMARQKVVCRELLVIMCNVINGMLPRDFNFISFYKHLRDVKYLGLFDFDWPNSVAHFRRNNAFGRDPYDAMFFAQCLPNIESFGWVHAEDIDVIINYASHLKNAGKPVKIKTIEVGTEHNVLSPATVRDFALKITKLVELCTDLESVVIRTSIIDPTVEVRPHWRLLSLVLVKKVFPKVKALEINHNLGFPEFIQPNQPVNFNLSRISIKILAVLPFLVKDLVRCAPNLEYLELISNIDVFRELKSLTKLKRIGITIFTDFEIRKYNASSRKKEVVEFLKVRGEQLKQFIYIDEGPKQFPIDNFSFEVVKLAPNLRGLGYAAFDWTLVGQFKKLLVITIAEFTEISDLNSILVNAKQIKEVTISTLNQGKAQKLYEHLETELSRSFIRQNCRFLTRILVVGWPINNRRAFRY